MMYNNYILSRQTENEIKTSLCKHHLLSAILMFFLILVIYLTINRATPSLSQRTNMIKKPLTDNREYDTIILSNKLEILLISEKDALFSAISMTTWLAITNEDMNYQGVNVLLQRYFISDSFNNTIKKNLGKIQYDIDDDTSSYYIEVKSEGFDDTISQFSSMLNNELNISNNVVNDMLDESNYNIFMLKKILDSWYLVYIHIFILSSPK